VEGASVGDHSIVLRAGQGPRTDVHVGRAASEGTAMTPARRRVRQLLVSGVRPVLSGYRDLLPFAPNPETKTSLSRLAFTVGY
jgi:hypothetical protein